MVLKKSRRTKHKRHHKKKHRKKTKHHHRRQRMRGGSRTAIALKNKSPAAPFNENWGGPAMAFPPGPMYSPGVYDDAKYYGKLNTFLSHPANTHGTGVDKNHGRVGGGKRRRQGKRKSRKGRKKSRRKKNKSRKVKRKSRNRRGGDISQFLANNVPGFSDIRDVYWKGGEVLKNGYNQWFGFPKVDNTSAGVQPIGNVVKVVKPNVANVATNLKTGADFASKYTN